ncbi:MAG: SirB2 family protein [Gammaproteobacteria bacterium]|nr:SirB2 family protein [Gammaproteobacteria bacterium]
MNPETYLLLRGVHLTSVGLSLGLFLLRGWWHWRGSALRRSRWARVVPHVNDTVLLLAGIGLAVMLRQYPLAAPWLTAKLVGLLLHIVLAMAAFKGWVRGPAAGVAWAGSLAAFGYVVGVALSRDPGLGLVG